MCAAVTHLMLPMPLLNPMVAENMPPTRLNSRPVSDRLNRMAGTARTMMVVTVLAVMRPEFAAETSIAVAR